MRSKLLVGLMGAAMAMGALAHEGVHGPLKARHDGMEAIGAAFKGLMDQTRGTPDAATVKRHAATIAALSPKVPAWFGPGTAAPPGMKTGAKPEIWTRPAEFRKAAAAFDAQARKTLAVANSGNMAALGSEVRALGGTCKGCHDDFRLKDD